MYVAASDAAPTMRCRLPIWKYTIDVVHLNVTWSLKNSPGPYQFMIQEALHKFFPTK